MLLARRLVRKGIVSAADLAKVAEAYDASCGKPLHALLMDRGLVKEEDVFAAMAEEFDMELVDLTKVQVEPETLKSVPVKLVHLHRLLPLSRNNGSLVVATGDPFDVYALDELQTLTGLVVQPVLASPREIARLIKTHFGVGGDTVAALAQ